MKNCSCGAPVTIEDNEIDPVLYQAPYHTLKFRVACTECHIRTKFYDTREQASTAWANKRWVNTRRVA